MYLGESLEDYKTQSQEFAVYDGVTAFDVLVKNTDPNQVSFELDLFWAAVTGRESFQRFNTWP